MLSHKDRGVIALIVKKEMGGIEFCFCVYNRIDPTFQALHKNRSDHLIFHSLIIPWMELPTIEYNADLFAVTQKAECYIP